MRRGFLNNKKVKTAPLYPAEKVEIRLPKGLQGEEHYQKGPDGRTTLKIPYGNSGEAELPEQYKRSETLYKELDGQLDNKTDGINVVYTTIPQQYLDAPKHPDGHTECIVLGATKAQIVRSSNYLSQSIPKFACWGRVVIKEAPEGAGLGMFAERDIKFGELVLAERPLLMQPAVSAYNPLGGAEVDEYTFEQHMTIMRHEQEVRLELAVGRMSTQNQAAYKALANAHMEDGSGPLLGVLRTNGFGINVDELTGTTSGLGLPSIYSIVLKDGSRINHSCIPNVCHKFSIASFSSQFYALRDIKAGEQIFYPYCDPILPVDKRREKLAPYGFVCTCRACSTASPESDRFRETCKENIALYQRIYKLAEGQEDVKEKVLDPVTELRDRMVEEGLGVPIFSEEFADVTVLLHKVYIKLGMEEAAKGLDGSLKVWAALNRVR